MLMETLIIPLVKDKKESVEDKNNYRPIAIANILSKVLENILQQRCEDYLITTHNQFGFKKNSSTDMCIFAFKETISYYNDMTSPVYTSFLDLSKAFDRVNNWILLKKFIERGMPKLYIRFFCYWFKSQQFALKWKSTVSQFFNVTNGVKQGGILSPVFFNVFIDDLSHRLTQQGIGCFVNNTCLNHLSYADDMVLLAPSPCALQQLLDCCLSYATSHDLVYNTKKSKCMSFHPRNYKGGTHTFRMGTEILPTVVSYTYLGVVISDCKSDNYDIQRAVRAQYTQGNRLLRKFSKCSKDVKKRLFQSYCSSFYGAHLWSNYTQASIHTMKVAYNNSYRFLMGLKRDCSISGSLVFDNVLTFGEWRRKLAYSIITRIAKSENMLLKSFENTLYYCYVSPLTKLWHELLYL